MRHFFYKILFRKEDINLIKKTATVFATVIYSNRHN